MLTTTKSKEKTFWGDTPRTLLARALPSPVRRAKWRQAVSDLLPDASSDKGAPSILTIIGVVIAVISVSATISIALIKSTGENDARYNNLAQKVSQQGVQLDQITANMASLSSLGPKVSDMKVQISDLHQAVSRERVHQGEEDSLLTSINVRLIKLGQKFDDQFPAPPGRPR